METDRIDGFGPVHKGIRHLMSIAMLKVGNIDYDDDNKLKRFRPELDRVWGLLDFHAEGEEEFVFPYLEEVDLILFNQLMEEHDSFRHKIDEMKIMFDQIMNMESDDGERRQKGKKFVKEFNDCIAHFYVHMQNEELKAMPVLWRKLNDKQIMKISQKIASRTPQELKVLFFPYHIRALNIYEREALLLGMKAAMAEDAFNGILEGAHRALDEEDWVELKRRLG